MYASVSDGYVHLSVTKVPDEPLAPSIEERFRVLGFRACFENFLVVENDGAISGWQVVAFFLLISFLALVCLGLVNSLEFEAGDLMDLNTENPRRIFLWGR
jgi:hypothetical protein